MSHAPCYQFGLLPRVLWQLAIYDVPPSSVEQMERKVIAYIRRWLGVPRSFATNALYASSFKLTLPITPLVEEYKTGKIRTHAMLHYSHEKIGSHGADVVFHRIGSAEFCGCGDGVFFSSCSGSLHQGTSMAQWFYVGRCKISPPQAL